MKKLITFLGAATIALSASAAMASTDTYCFQRADRSIGEVVVQDHLSHVGYSNAGSGRLNSIQKTAKELVVKTYLSDGGDGFPATITITKDLITLSQGTRILDQNTRIDCPK